MVKSGPKPAHKLEVVRDSPGEDDDEEAAATPEVVLDEPNWLQHFPAQSDPDRRKAGKRCREIARATWKLSVADLAGRDLLKKSDITLLRDYCICIARLDECERFISDNGIAVQTERGWAKNPATSIATGYRTAINRYVPEFELTPSSRAQRESGGERPGEGGAVFDV